MINTARSVFKGKKLRFEFTFASLTFRSLGSTDGCTLIVFAVPTTGVDRLLNVVSKIIIPQAIIQQQKRHGSLQFLAPSCPVVKQSHPESVVNWQIATAERLYTFAHCSCPLDTPLKGGKKLPRSVIAYGKCAGVPNR